MDIASRTICEIKELIASANEQEIAQLIDALERDVRAGVRRLAASYRRGVAKASALERALLEMLTYEQKLEQQGFVFVAGVDEAGRGALAGPLVAAAVILPKQPQLFGLKDSKCLSPEQRDEFYDRIVTCAVAYNVVRIEHSQIDSGGIQHANLAALQQAAQGLAPQPDYVLSDAFRLDSLDIPHLAIVKGDTLSLSIAAASVLAKVTRDRIMMEYHKMYPHYGFDQHKGYGTPSHLEALAAYGISPIHRTYFAPVAEYEQLTLDGT